jgi:hypothetical protein
MEPAPELVSLMERTFRNWDALDANGMSMCAGWAGVQSATMSG